MCSDVGGRICSHVICAAQGGLRSAPSTATGTHRSPSTVRETNIHVATAPQCVVTRNANTAFVPPKAKELDSIVRPAAPSLATLAT